MEANLKSKPSRGRRMATSSTPAWNKWVQEQSALFNKTLSENNKNNNNLKHLKSRLKNKEEELQKYKLLWWTSETEVTHMLSILMDKKKRSLRSNDSKGQSLNILKFGEFNFYSTHRFWQWWPQRNGFTFWERDGVNKSILIILIFK